MHADMTSVTIQSNKIVLNNVSTEKTPQRNPVVTYLGSHGQLHKVEAELGAAPAQGIPACS